MVHLELGVDLVEVAQCSLPDQGIAWCALDVGRQAVGAPDVRQRMGRREDAHALAEYRCPAVLAVILAHAVVPGADLVVGRRDPLAPTAYSEDLRQPVDVFR